MYLQRTLILSIVLPICVLAHGAAIADTYFVWKDEGNDKNTGLSWEQSWKSLDVAAANALPGDTVIIRRSSLPYKYLRIHRSGTADNPITFRGEFKSTPPIISGAVSAKEWTQSSRNGVWINKSRIEPAMLIANDKLVKRASDMSFSDGNWFWKNEKLLYKTGSAPGKADTIWKLRNGGGIIINSKSWVTLENFYCWIGRGACVSIKASNHIVARNIHAKWNWRGVDITNGSSYNLVEDSLFEENREGAYIRNRSSNNTIRNCSVFRSGMAPLWSKGDRHAVAIGEEGPNSNNIIENCEIAYNGAPPDNVALISFRAPSTVFRGNNVHHNFGSGIFITTDSHFSRVINNNISDNGHAAAKTGIKGIAALRILNSHSVRVINNKITNNAVSGDSIYENIYTGVHGGLDIDGHKGVDMRNLVIQNNTISGTSGGPDFHVSDRPNTDNILIDFPTMVPAWVNPPIAPAWIGTSDQNP